MNGTTLIEKKHNAVVVRNVFTVLCCIMLVSVMMLGTSTVAYCSNTGTTNNPGDAIQSGITEMATQIYTTMRAIITPLTIIAFAFAGFQFLTGGNQGTEKAKKTLIAGGMGLALVIFAPLFGQAIATWFASQGSGSLDQYNPLA